MNHSAENTPTVACPTCQQNVIWQPSSPYRPFCSSRCKLIDLGAWAAEDYSVAASTDSTDSSLLP